MATDPALEALKALSQFLVSEARLGDTLEQIVGLTQKAVPAADFIGISMTDESGAQCTPIYTDKRAPGVDQAQYDSDRGPCLDAWRKRQAVPVPRMEDAGDRYPEFAASALEAGVRSTLSLPLLARESSIGALNMYSGRHEAFHKRDEDTADDFARSVAAVLANSRAYWDSQDLTENLNKAMASRAVIEQAKGMLMARDDSLDSDSAFDLLRRASQRENLKLREIARRIVERRAPGETL